MGAETLLLVNPSRRRKAGPKRRRARVRRNPIGAYLAGNPSKRRRMRRNPIGRSGSVSGVRGMVQPVLWGAVGATGVNAVVNMLPLPVSMKLGVTGALTRAVTAIALGTVGARMIPNARAMAIGSLICTTKEVLDGVVGGILPGAGTSVAGLGYYAPAMRATAPRMPNNVPVGGTTGPRLQGIQTITAGGVSQGKVGGSKLAGVGAYLR